LELIGSGAVGVALLLGAAPSANAAQNPPDRQPTIADAARVSERLATIREAVSEAARTAEQERASGALDGLRLAWHNWGNGVWRQPWANWGWGTPWGNVYRPWNNWNNWRNGWNNWRNRWANR
jgi:rSAM-associated Gly-rich repeat protein